MTWLWVVTKTGMEEYITNLAFQLCLLININYEAKLLSHLFPELCVA